MSNAHHLLQGALKVAPPESHPRSPFHFGGPQPKIDAQAYVVAALWLVDRIAPHVDPRDRQTFDRYVQLARRQLAVGPDDTEHQRELYSADASKASRVPCKIGHWAAHEAANWAFRPIYAGGAARPAAANVARFLVKKDPASLRRYLADLDVLCVHLEALTMLRARKQTPAAPVVRTLWRGHREGKATHWLMRLRGESFALLGKQGARWQLTTGTRDHVLATVPDDLFESAVHAAMPPVTDRSG